MLDVTIYSFKTRGDNANAAKIGDDAGLSSLGDAENKSNSQIFSFSCVFVYLSTVISFCY